MSKIMTKNPISVNLSQSLREVNTIFKERNIHHLPVVSGDKVIGVISKSDIDRITFVAAMNNANVDTALYDMLTIEQVMTKDVETIEETDQIREAAAILARGTFHALPVTKDNKLTGIVTSTDMINHLLEQYS